MLCFVFVPMEWFLGMTANKLQQLYLSIHTGTKKILVACTCRLLSELSRNGTVFCFSREGLTSPRIKIALVDAEPQTVKRGNISRQAIQYLDIRQASDSDTAHKAVRVARPYTYRTGFAGNENIRTVQSR